MQIKNNHSSIGNSKNSMPEWYFGLKLQTPILVKIISQTIKNIAVIIIAGKTDRQRFTNRIRGSKLYKNGIINEPMLSSKYNDIFL